MGVYKLIWQTIHFTLKLKNKTKQNKHCSSWEHNPSSSVQTEGESKRVCRDDGSQMKGFLGEHTFVRACAHGKSASAQRETAGNMITAVVESLAWKGGLPLASPLAGIPRPPSLPLWILVFPCLICNNAPATPALRWNSSAQCISHRTHVSYTWGFQQRMWRAEHKSASSVNKTP